MTWWYRCELHGWLKEFISGVLELDFIERHRDASGIDCNVTIEDRDRPNVH
jgi:hypothetical protein